MTSESLKAYIRVYRCTQRLANQNRARRYLALERTLRMHRFMITCFHKAQAYVFSTIPERTLGIAPPESRFSPFASRRSPSRKSWFCKLDPMADKLGGRANPHCSFEVVLNFGLTEPVPTSDCCLDSQRPVSQAYWQVRTLGFRPWMFINA